MNIKLNDIFRWSYTPERLKELRDGDNGGTTYWAVSRICICREHLTTKELYLEDTYWGGSDNVRFYSEGGNFKNITLNYLGNFDELDKFTHGEYYLPYYNPSDILDLSHGNSYGKQIYIKKGAQRSVNHIKLHLESKIDELTNKVVWAQRDLEKAREQLKNLSEENKNNIYS